MEIEAKYLLPSKETLESIWSDPEIIAMSEPSSAEKVPLFAVYYDTPERMLRSRRLTLRVRSEGERAFATIKWGGSSEEGLHIREEVNIPVAKISVCCPPDVSLFSATEKGEELRELTERSSLVPMLSMEFTRSRVRLRYQGNVIELALDCGSIRAEKGTAPILELELEHYAGPDSSSVTRLGKMLSERYGLKPENTSKYARGLALL